MCRMEWIHLGEEEEQVSKQLFLEWCATRGIP